MTDLTRPTERSAARECPRCAETVAEGVAQCGFCGHALRPRRSVSTRLIEVASLAAVLAVVILVCRLLGDLLGIG